MVIKTVVLKLHNLSGAKKAVIDDAISRYNRALTYLFGHTRENVGPIASEMKSGSGFLTRRITALLKKEVMDELNQFGVQPFKDALKLDYAMTMVGWLSLRKTQKTARYPHGALDEEAFQERFTELVGEFDERKICRKEFEAQLGRLYSSLHMQKPILFGRYAKNRDYCLLYDEESGRFYAKIYLMSVKDKARRGGIARGDTKLRYVYAGNEPLETDNRQERYLVVPLSFGKRQHEILLQGLKNPKMFKTARLSCKEGEYYLSVNVACEYPQTIRSETYLGITRGLSCAVCYAVTDRDGTLVAEGRIPKGKSFRSKNGMHALANGLVGIAQQYKSTVITYKLGSIGDRLTSGEEHAQLTSGEFNKLVAVVLYKTEAAGLEKPVLVSPRGIFYTCPRCGRNSFRNRFFGGRMICLKCGFSDTLEHIGPRNAARRLIQYGSAALVFYATQGKDDILIENKMLEVKYHAKASREAVEHFYDYVEQLACDMREGRLPLAKRDSKKISYQKRFMQVKDARKEVVIIDR